MEAELKALREEIAALRQELAQLRGVVQPSWPYTSAPQWVPPIPVTCDAPTGPGTWAQHPNGRWSRVHN